MGVWKDLGKIAKATRGVSHIVPEGAGGAAQAGKKIEPALEGAGEAAATASTAANPFAAHGSMAPGKVTFKPDPTTGMGAAGPTPGVINPLGGTPLTVKHTHNPKAPQVESLPASPHRPQGDAEIPRHLQQKAERTAYLKQHGIEPPHAPNVGVNGKTNMLDSYLHNRRVRRFEKEHFGDLKPDLTKGQIAARAGLGVVFAAAVASPFADGAGLVTPGAMNPLTLGEHVLFNLPDLVTGRDSTSPISSIVVNTGKMTQKNYLDEVSRNHQAHPDIQLEAAAARTKGAAENTAQGTQAAARRDASVQSSMEAGANATADRLKNERPLPAPEPSRN